ncbi:hypothetical protein DFH08DRAFT_945122 [Mycena albidolilacea]|uniref:F-box domain-containing protein n=1 Tax=Mycena albidolilacea TaxID=1033008 RepID=A0AAD6Z2H7_9AGAR|nr:hypothetical protein DFH08DRAFT_945122 [Mycena albidolilacea]
MTTAALFSASSLPDLPTELLVEIISHYASPFTFLSPLVREEHAATQQEKAQVLRALSQTCSDLRRIFLPLLWERLEVSQLNFREIHTRSELATLIFPYIRSVHISLKSWSPSGDMETVFLFIEFLRALPNLTGLQIYNGVPWLMVPIFSYAFADASFPALTALAIPDSLTSILPAFPNVKTLGCPSLSNKGKLIAAAKTHLPHLEALAGLRSRDLGDNFRPALAPQFPHLRALSMASTSTVEYKDMFPRLHAFTQLSELELLYQDDPDLLSLEELVAGGRNVLRASHSTDVKALRVWALDKSAGPQIVYFERC